MHDAIHGFYEARADGENREHFRLFCLLEREGVAVGIRGPSLIIIAGMRKSFTCQRSRANAQRVRAAMRQVPSCLTSAIS